MRRLLLTDRLPCACDRVALDRPGHRRRRLAGWEVDVIGSLQWAQYGALLAAVGLILIWQGKR